MKVLGLIKDWKVCRHASLIIYAGEGVGSLAGL